MTRKAATGQNSAYRFEEVCPDRQTATKSWMFTKLLITIARKREIRGQHLGSLEIHQSE